jgi:glucokinase
LLLIDIMSVGISLGAQGEGSQGSQGSQNDIEQRRLLISHLDI